MTTTRASNNNTPRPTDNATASSSTDPQGQPQRPLNVTDALSYLDAVKNQFQNNPDIYNQFLDIMKDFKSQVIDTPGVIERVSRLFHGNPVLIQGFNTFLPVGYRIDVSADPLDPNTITVTTPMGTVTQTTDGTSNPIFTATRQQRDSMPLPQAAIPPQLYPVTTPLVPPLPNPPLSRSLTPHAFQLAHSQPPFDPIYSPGTHQTQTNAAAFLNNLNGNNNHSANSGKNSVEMPPGEFNHAIQYLNKIKARYAEDPNTYKQFLDILQTYQKETKLGQDSQVFVQVKSLFKDAPELLAEFQDFLPEAVPNMGPGMTAMMPPHAAPGGVWPQNENSPPQKKAAQAQSSRRSRKRGPEKDPTPVPTSKPRLSLIMKVKKVKHSHNQEHDSPSFAPYAVPPSPPLGHMYPNSQIAAHSHAQAQGIHPHPDYQNNNATNKLLFFDRAKKSLENREAYVDYLKLLDLFSRNVLDVPELIERSKVFLGDGELMTEFKDLMGFDDKDRLAKGPPGSIRTGPPEMPSVLPVDDGEGPSYRRLPPSETRLACSGRDELCRSVLNDDWVSHPTWASEESGFVAHKKTLFEDALHKSEEERHEYHVQIEALTRTIAVLEPINSRIDEMTNEERSQFKLPPSFGGPSMAIYHRIIKKIYGRDPGMEAIQALQESPCVAVPIVLNRLKAKDEEWRRSQREWSRTWKEVDCKNFYKSLDHQGINFKQNDKKNITAKHFVQDIEAIKKQQLDKLERKGIKLFTRGSVGHQLEYDFKNVDVLNDAIKLVFTFLDRNHAVYSPLERRAVEKFLRAFVPTLCASPEASTSSPLIPTDAVITGPSGTTEEEAPNDLSDGARSSGGVRRSVGSPHGGQAGGVPASDLRKKLLKTAQEKARKEAGRAASTSGVGSRAVSPSPGGRSPRPPRVDEERQASPAAASNSNMEPHDIWIKEASLGPSSESYIVSGSENDRPFFANTTFYTLLRLLELLYSRLLMCHEIGAKYAAEKHSSLLNNPVAVDLGLDDPNGPASVLAQTMDHLGNGASEDSTNVVYMYLLTACEKLFDNELEQGTFEEHMRWFFGTKAYTLFTLDKLIMALIKQVQTILGDNRCQELWSLLKSAQNSKNITTQDIIRYRREAERHVGQDDHLYRIQWVAESRSIRVSLYGQEEASVETDGTATSRWREYVNTYVMKYSTEWLPKSKKKSNPVYLRRCMRVDDEGTAPLVSNLLRIRIGLPGYKLVYEDNGEDMIVHYWDDKEEGRLIERARRRENERKKIKLLF
ncbi:hypothetical protein CVT24_008894 [Panaeolus cyanescens]|uniref:Histone deacetylase interacting domain-containing protein n=1 Tax=Panaeolus cyanescens TaxID=181874 RepID=A0A409VAX9_9AGAR|nr:hypothetical protein CVT24_008894 [Panaeolus cyanescens]